MSRVCEICGKGPVSGNNVSHSERKTRRKWYPNLQTVKIETDARKKRVKVCTRCIKSNKIMKTA